MGVKSISGLLANQVIPSPTQSSTVIWSAQAQDGNLALLSIYFDKAQRLGYTKRADVERRASSPRATAASCRFPAVVGGCLPPETLGSTMRIYRIALSETQLQKLRGHSWRQPRQMPIFCTSERSWRTRTQCRG